MCEYTSFASFPTLPLLFQFFCVLPTTPSWIRDLFFCNILLYMYTDKIYCPYLYVFRADHLQLGSYPEKTNEQSGSPSLGSYQPAALPLWVGPLEVFMSPAVALRGLVQATVLLLRAQGQLPCPAQRTPSQGHQPPLPWCSPSLWSRACVTEGLFWLRHPW